MVTFAPTISTTSGPVRGEQLERAAIYRGIPYAAGPVGPLRFAAPIPHPGWAKVRDAVELGPTPLVRPEESGTIPEIVVDGDSYLNLSVTTPALPSRNDGAQLPVQVWIHGGSFVRGSVGGGWFDGLSHADAGVVHVAISYRLGFEGYGHIPGAPDNRAILDMIAALQWVQQNIAAFGGDPAQVTVAGQSAGAGAALALLVCPSARGLFQRMILHSHPRIDHMYEDAVRVGEQMAKVAGVDHSLQAWLELSREAIVDAEDEVMGTTLWDSVQDLYRIVSRSAPTTAFGPVFGTALLPLAPLDALAQGWGAQIPLIVGSTKDEFNDIAQALEPTLGSVSVMPVLQIAGLPAELARAYPKAYPDSSAAQLVGQVMTDLIFRIPALAVAATHQGDTWMWDFRWHQEGKSSRHCIDLPFAFNLLDAPRMAALIGEHPPSELAAEFFGDLIEFMHTGLAPWLQFTADAPVAKVYDSPTWIGRDPYRFVRIAAQLLAE